VDGTGPEREVDPVVGPDGPEVLVDIEQFYGHLTLRGRSRHAFMSARYLALLAPSMPSRSLGMYQICLSVATSPCERNTDPSW